MAAPPDITARAGTRDAGELARLVTPRARCPGGGVADGQLPDVQGRTPIAMNHSTAIRQLGEGAVQAVCSCGWRSPVFGADKTTGTMDPLQHATEAADLHKWEMSLRLAPQA